LLSSQVSDVLSFPQSSFRRRRLFADVERSCCVAG
jgi:hypothetical protein